MKNLFLLLLMTYALSSFGQQSTYVYKNVHDSSYNCYLTLIPEEVEIKGLIVRDYSSLPKPPNSPSYPYRWKKLALENGIAILYTVSSSYFPELCYTDTPLIILDELIHEVVRKHDIPTQNIFIGGISASGTRALKYAQFCEKGKSKYGIKIKGVFAVDPPLDYERFYNSAFRHQSNFKEGMLWEAELMLNVFPNRLNGSPQTNSQAYVNRSVFSHTDPSGGNISSLIHTSTLFFHEPDIEWWIHERGSTYYDINSYDIAAAYNYLKLHQHPDIQLITTSGKGFDRKGNRNCHSWSIVDEDYLINWIIERIR